VTEVPTPELNSVWRSQLSKAEQDSISIVAHTGLRASALSVCFVGRTGRAMVLPPGSTRLRVRVGANQCGTRGVKGKAAGFRMADGFAVLAREAEDAGRLPETGLKSKTIVVAAAHDATMSNLTEQQTIIVRLVRTGLSNKQIARQLSERVLSRRTYIPFTTSWVLRAAIR
jgi:hypothetical protein